MERQNISSDSPYEPRVGYSRAVRVGPYLHVAGTTASVGGKVSGDIEAQTRQAFRNIQSAVERAGFQMKHVVRTRMFVIDITAWETIGRVHAEFFRDIRPAATMVQVSGFVSPDMLIEIEVDAILHDE